MLLPRKREHSISGADADGVSLAAIHGLYHEISRLNKSATEYKEYLAWQQSTIAEQQAQLAKQELLLQHLQGHMNRLWKMVSGRRLSSISVKVRS